MQEEHLIPWRSMIRPLVLTWKLSMSGQYVLAPVIVVDWWTGGLVEGWWGTGFTAVLTRTEARKNTRRERKKRAKYIARGHALSTTYWSICAKITLARILHCNINPLRGQRTRSWASNPRGEQRRGWCAVGRSLHCNFNSRRGQRNWTTNLT